MGHLRVLVLAGMIMGFAAGCGPADNAPDYKPVPVTEPIPPASPAQARMLTGDPAHLAQNELTFAPIVKGKKDVKDLIFTAPSDGKFMTDAGPVGDLILSWGCDGDGPSGTINAFKKDPATGQFTAPAEIDATDGGFVVLNPTFTLKAGEQLDIRIELDGRSNCNSATTTIGAGFQPN
jgi:hypothetical protein